MRPALSWKSAAPYAIVAIAVAVYLYPFVRIFSDAPDYGVFLNGAYLINHGALPSRDFVEPQGPGSFLWLAIFFRVFGATLATARAVLDATGVGIALLTFYLSRHLGASGLFAVVFVTVISIPLLPINSPHYDSNLFALGAFAIFVAQWDRWKKGETALAPLLIAAALLCGVTTWMIQQKGLYLMLALMFSTGWLLRAKAIKPVLIMSGVYGAMVLLPFAFFAARHALPDYVYANYIWPLTNYSNLNACPYGFPIWRNLAMTLQHDALHPVAMLIDIAASVPFFVVAALPLVACFPVYGSDTGQAGLMPYWPAGYALWFAELQRLDMGHLRNGVVLLAIIFFSQCEAGEKLRASASSKILKRIGLAVTLCVVLAGTMNWAGSWPLAKPNPDSARLLEFLKTHTHPGEYVFVYPYQPIYYFVAKVQNPTRYSYMQYSLHTPAQFAEAVREIEQKKVRYVVFDTLLSGEHFAYMFPAYRQPDKPQLIMEPYLEAHYRQAYDLGRFHILEREP